MFIYHRTAMYYETDGMAIIHHANYLHWMEEARIAWMDSFGFGYDRLVQMGIASPLTGIQIRYLQPTRFKDDVAVEVTLRSYDGVRCSIGYVMRVGEVTVCEAVSEHVFTGTDGRVLRLRRACPELDLRLKELATGSSEVEA